MNKPLAALFALCLAAPAAAADGTADQPGSRAGYIRDQDEAVLICAPLQICTIKLRPGERIQANGLHLGETARWHVEATLTANNQTHLIVKPIDVGLQTTMIILTNRRKYIIKLHFHPQTIYVDNQLAVSHSFKRSFGYISTTSSQKNNKERYPVQPRMYKTSISIILSRVNTT